MTFFDSSGFRRFEPEGADEWLGKMLRLDFMACPRCGKRMKRRTIMGSKHCDKVEYHDECPDCGYRRMTRHEVSS